MTAKLNSLQLNLDIRTQKIKINRKIKKIILDELKTYKKSSKNKITKKTNEISAMMSGLWFAKMVANGFFLSETIGNHFPGKSKWMCGIELSLQLVFAGGKKRQFLDWTLNLEINSEHTDTHTNRTINTMA